MKHKYNVGDILDCRGKIGKITEVNMGFPSGASKEMLCYYLEIIGDKDQIFDEPRTEVFACSYADMVFRPGDAMSQILFNERDDET